jgi:hypothetical protein
MSTPTWIDGPYIEESAPHPYHVSLYKLHCYHNDRARPQIANIPPVYVIKSVPHGQEANRESLLAMARNPHFFSRTYPEVHYLPKHPKHYNLWNQQPSKSKKGLWGLPKSDDVTLGLYNVIDYYKHCTQLRDSLGLRDTFIPAMNAPEPSVTEAISLSLENGTSQTVLLSAITRGLGLYLRMLGWILAFRVRLGLQHPTHNQGLATRAKNLFATHNPFTL